MFDQLGATVWQAKALYLLSDVYQGRGDVSRASVIVDEAMARLAAVDSREAARLREELRTTKSALLAGGSVGNADSIS